MAGIKAPPVIKIKAVVDIVFCIDCTNRAAIANCMESQIMKFVEALNTTNEKLFVDWRARVVGYGDLEMEEAVQNGNEFVSDVDQIRKQLNGLEPCYGGDIPESTLDAICYAVKTSDWRERCHKAIFVLTDAPTKGLHSSTQKVFGVCNVDELKMDLVEKHIKLFLWGPNDPVYESFKYIPESEIILLDDVTGVLYHGKIDLTEYLDWIWEIHGYVL